MSAFAAALVETIALVVAIAGVGLVLWVLGALVWVVLRPLMPRWWRNGRV